MNFQVKSKRSKQIKNIIGLISTVGLIDIPLAIVPFHAETKDDANALAFWGIVIITSMTYYLTRVIGAEILNSVDINSDTITIKKVFKAKRELTISDIRQYSVGMKKMYKYGSRECIHIFYDDTYIELYADNVCNFEMLVEYLRKNRVPRCAFKQPIL